MIPVSAPDLSGNEEAYVRDAVRSSWISSTGPYIERFEREFAEFAGAGHALSVSNGTVALHLALLSLGIGPGDEVILPSLTYVATANAVRYVGATPVFVDVDLATWCIDPLALPAAITVRTRALMAVHLYGHPCDMDAINGLATEHGISVVEDAAEAHGALYRGQPVGGLGDVATFSFYGNKILTSGEGGAVTTNDGQLAATARMLRGQGMDPSRRYFFPIVGHNFRLTNVACALLCAQLERYEQMMTRRRHIERRYSEGLGGIPGITLQPVADWARATPWLFCLLVEAQEFGCSRDELAARLARAGVDSRPFFIPIHQLPPYVDDRIPAGGLPITERLAGTGLNLPTFAGMTDSQLDEVVDAVRAAATG